MDEHDREWETTWYDLMEKPDAARVLVDNHSGEIGEFWTGKQYNAYLREELSKPHLTNRDVVQCVARAETFEEWFEFYPEPEALGCERARAIWDSAPNKADLYKRCGIR